LGGYLPLAPGVSTVRYPIQSGSSTTFPRFGARRPERAKLGPRPERSIGSCPEAIACSCRYGSLIQLPELSNRGVP